MCSACHSARRLRRVAIVRRWALTLLVGNQLAHRRPLPATHRQALADTVEYHLPVRLLLAAAGALEAADRGTRYEAVAVDANERTRELALERDQRLLDQVLALARAHGDVFLLGAQEQDVLHRDQHDAMA